MISLLLFLASTVATAATAGAYNCTQSCGLTTAPYPFGFSAGCKIPLSCANGSVAAIGGLPVRNITADHLILDVPLACNRSAAAAATNLSGPNFALTAKNVLFLRNCSASNSSRECLISTDIVADQLDLGSCGSKGDNVSCFSRPRADGGFLSAKEVSAAGCRFLFTAVMYEVGADNLTALLFKAAELGWWLDGACRCDANATCTTVRSPVTGGSGFRCRCREGFEGDGFADGVGCSAATIASCGSASYVSGKCGGSNRVGLLVGGILAGALAVAGAAIICFLLLRRRRRSASAKLHLLQHTERLFSEASFSVPLYSYKTLERATDGFSDSRRLGTGAYGAVFSGKLPDGNLVAIKRLRHPDPQSMDQVANEVKLISSVSHPGLVRLLGCCLERGEQILVYEFMPNGTLSQHLQRQRGPGLPWPVRLAIAADTAAAIAHLHSAVSPPIYHRDVKSSNILLDHRYRSKVADFGLSRTAPTESSHVSTAPQGTPGYVDPQYHQNFHLSDKSDVYSFGVVLAEMITAMKAVDFGRPQSEVNLAALAVDRIGKGRVEEIVDPLLRPAAGEEGGWVIESIRTVAELAFRCLAFQNEVRPSMAEVADELERIRGTGWLAEDGEELTALAPPSEAESGSLKFDRSDGSEGAVESRRVVALGKGNSPVSVQESWVSDLSSPSTGSLLGSANPPKIL